MVTRRYITTVLTILGRFLVKSTILVLASTWLVSLMIGCIPSASFHDPLNAPSPLSDRVSLAHSQYVDWLEGVVHCSFGYSSHFFGDPVSKYVYRAFMVTLLLTCGTLIFTGLLGSTLGFITATREKWRNHGSSNWFYKALIVLVRFSVYSVSAIPTYILAILILLFSTSVSSWLIASFSLMLGSGILMDFAQMSYHLMSEEYERPYVRNTIALGYKTGGFFPKPRYASWHALRGTLARLIPSVGGKIPYIIGNVLVVEIVLEIPGLSEPLLGGVLHRDLPLVLAVVFLTTLLVQAVALIMDLLDFILHPSKKFVF